jgi:capsular polysaccharide biosynthesis protein
VVVLEPGQGVHVQRLWTCSKIAYWPGGEKLPAPPVHDYELSDTRALAALVGRLQPRLDQLDLAGLPERIYLTRHARQGRPLARRGEVEAFFAARGFAVLDFTVVPMLEQLRHLRAARTVVLEAGSAMYGALFCRPGTRIGELADDDTSEHEWCAEMFRALGMSLLLFPCATGTPAGLTGATGMAVDLDRLDAYLAALESVPAPEPAIPDPSGAAS